MTASPLAETIGAVAGLLTTIAFLPQVVRTWRTRSTEDISALMFVLFCSGVALWLVYGLMIAALPVVLANAVTLVLAGSILVLKLRERKRRP
jgi:MtN3 and saliva related transmembrane protein